MRLDVNGWTIKVKLPNRWDKTFSLTLDTPQDKIQRAEIRMQDNIRKLNLKREAR